MVKEWDCLNCHHYQQWQNSATGLHFTNVNSFRIKLGIIKNLFVSLYGTGRCVSYFKDIQYQIHTDIATSLSNTQSQRWRDCISSIHFNTRVENYVVIDFTFFFILNFSYSVYSFPVSSIQFSKGKTFTTILLNINVIFLLRVSDSTSCCSKIIICGSLRSHTSKPHQHNHN